MKSKSKKLHHLWSDLIYFRKPSSGQGFSSSLGWNTYTNTFQQSYRVADNSYDLYELYVGVDGAPDYTASGQPVATSATLPFTWTPTPLPSSGNTTDFYCVVRKRNQYNLVGFNIFSTIIKVNSAGSQILLDPSAPKDVRLYNGTVSGSLRVISKYVKTDDPDPADTFEIYAKEGSAPVVGVDSPVQTVTMKFHADEAMLGIQLTDSNWAPADTIYVIVSALRTSDSARGSAAVVSLTLASSADLDQGFMFGGSAYEQK